MDKETSNKHAFFRLWKMLSYLVFISALLLVTINAIKSKYASYNGDFDLNQNGEIEWAEILRVIGEVFIAVGIGLQTAFLNSNLGVYFGLNDIDPNILVSGVFALAVYSVIITAPFVIKRIK